MILSFHRKFFRRRGQATLEYLALITFLVVAFFVFQKYISRGFAGRWRATGDSFGQGRQYDPNKTIDCAYYEGSALTGDKVKIWYESDCFDEKCTDPCYSVAKSPASCKTCMQSCDPSHYCRDNNPALPKP